MTTAKIADANVTAAKIATLTIGSVTAVKNDYKFLVYRNAAWTTSASLAVVQFDTKTYDTGTNIDVATNKGRFTAPVAGFYCFSAGVSINAGSASRFGLSLYKNGSVLLSGPVAASGTGNYGVGTGFPPVSLAANDYVEIYAIASGTPAGNVGSTETYFGGYLLSTT